MESPYQSRKDSNRNSSLHVISTITTLPEKLRLGSLEKENIHTNTHALINALFISKSRFISYTEANDEISLIMDEETSKLFPKDSIKLSEQSWRAIQFSLGSSPSETGGAFVSGISGPLSRAGISIFFLTTFNSDLILVEESKFEAAKACLKENFPIVWADESPVSEDSLKAINKSDNVPNNINQQSFSRLQAFNDLTLCLTSVRTSALTCAFKDLVELLFFGDSNINRFISFTQTEDEVSLIIDTKTLSKFPSEHLEVVLEDHWVPIKRLQKHGFSETGVVSAIAAPLANLSMLYLSSFQTGWLMVKKEHFSRAVEKLQEKGFIVSE